MTPTAEEILNRKKNELSVWLTKEGDQLAIEAMKEIASLSWEAGDNYRLYYYRRHVGSIQAAPDKESFMNKLF